MEDSWWRENKPHLLGRWPLYPNNPSPSGGVSLYHRTRKWRHCWRYRRRKFLNHKCHCAPSEYLDLTDSDTDSSTVSRWSKDYKVRKAPTRHSVPCHQDRCCVSDSEPTVMPGGFENSSLKNSFSLSSLPPSSQCLETPEHARLRERPYNSLTKKPRRDLEQESWRRSWGSKDESKLSSSFDINYQYLMDNKLIDSCKREFLDPLAAPLPAEEWTFDQFSESFEQLDSYLNSILDSFHSQNSDEIVNRNIQLDQVDEFKCKDFRRTEFNEQGERLVKTCPELRDEILQRIAHISQKWDQVRETVAIRSVEDSFDSSDFSSKKDADSEFKALRNWIKEMHERLMRIKFSSMGLQELDDMSSELKVLQADIKSKDRSIRALVELGRRGEQPPSKRNPYARLERRWLNFQLFVIECQCRVEDRQQVLSKQSQTSSVASSECSDDEPVNKLSRLSTSPGASHVSTPFKSHKSNILVEDVDGSLMDTSSHGETSVASPTSNHFSKLNSRHPFNQTMNAVYSSGLTVNGHEKSSNVGYYICKHLGSDCDEESDTTKTDTENSSNATAAQNAQKDRKSDNSSEEEWTYTANEHSGSSSETVTSIQLHKSVESLKQDVELVKPKINQEVTKKLIADVDKFVSPSKKALRLNLTNSEQCSSKPGHFRMNSWLRQCRNDDNMDSCDASGECTTDDDYNNRRSSADWTTSSFNDENTPVYETTPCTFPDEHPRSCQIKVKSPTAEGARPASFPSFSYLLAHQQQRLLCCHSKSESALNKILTNSPNSSSKTQMNTSQNLSSSTMEETTPHNPLDSGSSCSSRRRKFKKSKRSLARKNVTGSVDSISHLSHAESTLLLSASPLRCYRKSESVNEYARRVSSIDRSGVIDGAYVSTSSDSESESEVDNPKKCRKKLIAPKFALNKIVTPRNIIKPNNNLLISVNPDEPTSSLSETATWDSYQDKYPSETYSEDAPDPDAAKRFLEGDDDYRQFLDSQSDASSFCYRLKIKKKSGNRVEESSALESDSDLEDKILKFQSQFNEAKQFMNIHSQDVSSDTIQCCNDIIQELKSMLERRKHLQLSSDQMDSIKALLEKYVSLKNQAEGIQTELKLKKEMAQLKDDIIALAENVLSSGTDNVDRNELEKYINQMKKELECLHERKLKLTLVNLKVHQFKTESGVPVDDLKAEVAKLYQIWDYNYNRVSSQLESLQRVSNIWKQFEAHRNEFLSALGDDEKTIQLLDNALQDGDISPEIATSVRVVAKVLSEKRDDNSPPESLCETLSGATSLLDPCSGEGSLSDSGISDSGSEQDICEREKRLGEMRKLAKEMDLLSPGSLFAMDVNKRVQEMEAKLRELQRNCRNLIVKTAVCAETGCPAAPKKQFHLTPSKRCRSPVLKGELATADDGDDGDKPSQFWRILKCSMPFHLAIMLLVCVACLLEPHCCDSLNNFHRSIAPQMRYLYGPPPI
ncbi:unnamed protein product [Bemisia tabaci]|uniref:KASH domain-containing protein n=1 Tax=Bemisia tabaci TaxID=7038 RepID=A0A9P0G5H7_BEMTA|nr:unnamed protein product [Bemisia tabaci]